MELRELAKAAPVEVLVNAVLIGPDLSLQHSFL